MCLLRITPAPPSSWPKNRLRNAWLHAAAMPLLLAPAWVVIVQQISPASQLGSVAGLIAFMLLATSTYTDHRWKRIPNWATYTALSWALSLNLVGTCISVRGGVATDASNLTLLPQWLGSIGFRESLTGAVGCFAVMLMACTLCRAGGGDLKLATALGALVGLPMALLSLFWCFMIGGGVSLALVIWRQGFVGTARSLLFQIGSLVLPAVVPAPAATESQTLRTRIPMATFFAAGYCVALWEMSR